MKDIFLIKGQNGKKTLAGRIPVYGAKNAALPAFAATLLFKDRVRLTNVPDIEDIRRSAEIMQGLGAEVEREAAHAFSVNADKIRVTELNPEHAKHMRASVLFAGPLLAREGLVSFPHPGGCVIGERPIDIFLEAFEKMGARVRFEKETYTLTTEGKPLLGTEIFLRIPSPTATETLMMAAVLAKGTTILKNAAMEPEIPSLTEFLVACGAKIQGAGTPTIEIRGGGLLSARGRVYKTIPDRIEAGSFLILAALAGREVTVTDCEPAHLESLIERLRSAGVSMQISENAIKVTAGANAKNADYRAVAVKTHEYPGFPTDLQAPMSVFLTQVSGESTVFETIFDGRLNYAADLIKMGAALNVWNANSMTVKGPTPLRGRELEGPDLRAGLAYVLAAIAAKGRSVINNVHYIDRGYERIEERLLAVGVEIERVRN